MIALKPITAKDNKLKPQAKPRLLTFWYYPQAQNDILQMNFCHHFNVREYQLWNLIKWNVIPKEKERSSILLISTYLLF